MKFWLLWVLIMPGVVKVMSGQEGCGDCPRLDTSTNLSLAAVSSNCFFDKFALPWSAVAIPFLVCGVGTPLHSFFVADAFILVR